MVTQELVEEERARLIEERQGEVQRVLDRHDDLVRASSDSQLYLLTGRRYVKASTWKSLFPWWTMIPRCACLPRAAAAHPTAVLQPL